MYELYLKAFKRYNSKTNENIYLAFVKFSFIGNQQNSISLLNNKIHNFQIDLDTFCL